MGQGDEPGPLRPADRQQRQRAGGALSGADARLARRDRRSTRPAAPCGRSPAATSAARPTRRLARVPGFATAPVPAPQLLQPQDEARHRLAQERHVLRQQQQADRQELDADDRQ
ncbi:MAG: hypothetical protein MZW92_29540 [Comamonadaceae bacterium]|nr:hypothetical protein [Comamonadaceae bacterium]